MKRASIFVAAIVALSACSGSGSDVSSSTTTSPPTRPRASLRAALETLGVDVVGAPSEAAQLGSAQFCGYETRNANHPAGGNVAARRCFLDHATKNEEAVYVVSNATLEGAPFVRLFRWTSGGHLVIYVDSTRDPLSSGGWERGTCERVTTEFPNAPEPLPPYSFEGEGCEYASAATAGA